jgi:hypothetical protein
MKKLVQIIINTNLEGKLIHIALFVFRIALSLELIVAHGLKKTRSRRGRSRTGSESFAPSARIQQPFCRHSQLGVSGVCYLRIVHQSGRSSDFGGDFDRIFYPSLERCFADKRHAVYVQPMLSVSVFCRAGKILNR